MLRVVEQAFRTDTGRQRSANEDSLFARPPVYAVADGMGGAQAGEVASSIAAEAFEPERPPDQAPEAYLRGVAETANTRIHVLGEADASRSGMGTTLTAALIQDDEISLAHVGDSRAYRLRDEELRMLTSDHTLVEELRRQGRLTPEQAEEHPQRSIITRALGPEASVEVDTMTFPARPGDVYLLCSDGLTSMIKENAIGEVLRTSSGLETAVSRLVHEANQAGGRDNITVVAFRLEEAEAEAGLEGHPTLVGPAAEEAGLTAGAVREAATAERARVGGRAPRRPGEPSRPGERPPRRRGRTVLKGLIVLAVIAGLGVAAVFGARQIYFLGSDDGGRLALYRGLPYELPLDVKLYSEVYSTPVQLASLPLDRRPTATNHELRSRDDAVSLLDDLQASSRQPDLNTASQKKGRAKNTKKGGGGNAQGGHGKTGLRVASEGGPPPDARSPAGEDAGGAPSDDRTRSGNAGGNP